MKVERTPEFINWFKKETEKSKAQIDARLKNIELHITLATTNLLGKNFLSFAGKMVVEFITL